MPACSTLWRSAIQQMCSFGTTMMCAACSYGLEVAALAGVPRSVTQRARSAGTILERKLQRAFGKAPGAELSMRELRVMRRLHMALACGAHHGGATISAELSQLWHECQS